MKLWDFREKEAEDMVEALRWVGVGIVLLIISIIGGAIGVALALTYLI